MLGGQKTPRPPTRPCRRSCFCENKVLSGKRAFQKHKYFPNFPGKKLLSRSAVKSPSCPGRPKKIPDWKFAGISSVLAFCGEACARHKFLPAAGAVAPRARGVVGSGGWAGNTGHSGTILTGGEGVPKRFRSSHRSELAPIGLIWVLTGFLGPTKTRTHTHTQRHTCMHACMCMCRLCV